MLSSAESSDIGSFEPPSMENDSQTQEGGETNQQHGTDISSSLEDINADVFESEERGCQADSMDVQGRLPQIRV